MSTKNNENYWKNRKINWVEHYWSPKHSHRQAIINILKKYPIKSVLEIGCGAGANLWRIKKEFPDVRIAGCDINEDAIRTAKEQFKGLEDVEFKVGNITEIPFHGDSFDLVLTDAMLIYIGLDKIDRVIREIRRVGYNYFMFVEFHSTSFWKRLALRMTSRYYAYDYGKLLEEKHFKHIRIMKMSKELWSGEPWSTYGYIITSIR